MAAGGMGHQSRKERGRSQTMSRYFNRWSYETIRHWAEGGRMMPRFLS